MFSEEQLDQFHEAILSLDDLTRRKDGTLDVKSKRQINVAIYFINVALTSMIEQSDKYPEKLKEALQRLLSIAKRSDEDQEWINSLRSHAREHPRKKQ